MRWQIGRRSDNIEDRRGMSVGRGTAVGGPGPGTVDAPRHGAVMGVRSGRPPANTCRSGNRRLLSAYAPLLMGCAAQLRWAANLLPGGAAFVVSRS
jgi:hypothetical protein